MTRLRQEDLLSISERERIDEVCLAFEDEWLQGERPFAERYLAEADVPLRAALLHELLLIELEYRRGWGEVPAIADYLDRFEDDAVVRRAVDHGAHASVAADKSELPLLRGLDTRRAARGNASRKPGGASYYCAKATVWNLQQSGTVKGSRRPCNTVRPLCGRQR